MPVDCTRLEQLNCQYAFYFHPEGQLPRLYSNCTRFSSASVIKAPVLLTWAVLKRKGEVDPRNAEGNPRSAEGDRAELCCLDDEPQVQGAGLSWLLHSRQLPYQDVLLLMVAISDNLHDWGYTRRCDIFLFTQQVKDEPAALRVFAELGKLMAAS